MSKTTRLYLVLFILLFVLCGFQLYPHPYPQFRDARGLKAEVIHNPKPTHVEKDFSRLKIIKVIDDFHKDHFFAFPRSLAVDSKGNLFVYDRLLTKIFKFDKNYKFIKVFAREGRGPGDIAKGMRGGFNRKRLNISPDDRLLVSDCINRKILEYDSNGILTQEYLLGMEEITSFYPLVDGKKRLYVLTNPMRDGGVDVLNSKYEKIHTLLKSEDYLELMDYDPKYGWMKEQLTHTSPENTYYDLKSDNEFVIYLTNSSTLYLFEDFKLKKQFRIFPKRAMEIRKVHLEWNKETEREYKKQNPGRKFHGVLYSMVFSSFFMDQDDRCYFYLQGFEDEDKKHFPVYKFDFNGKLVNVLFLKAGDGFVSMMAKRHGLFFGIHADGKVYIMKETVK
ncbi:MAG: hypothetical protein GY765_09005 [bacterium]|nr:hypothetical protein [bacterium]